MKKESILEETMDARDAEEVDLSSTNEAENEGVLSPSYGTVRIHS